MSLRSFQQGTLENLSTREGLILLVLVLYLWRHRKTGKEGAATGHMLVLKLGR